MKLACLNKIKGFREAGVFEKIKGVHEAGMFEQNKGGS